MPTTNEEPRPATGADVQPLLVSVVEAGRRLCVSRDVIYDLINDGSLISVKVRGKRLIPLAAIHAFIEGLVEAQMIGGRRTGGKAA
jgi:excisionase family DNA binding protein